MREEKENVEFSQYFRCYCERSVLIHLFHHWAILYHPEKLKYDNQRVGTSNFLMDRTMGLNLSETIL